MMKIHTAWHIMPGSIVQFREFAVDSAIERLSYYLRLKGSHTILWLKDVHTILRLKDVHTILWSKDFHGTLQARHQTFL